MTDSKEPPLRVAVIGGTGHVGSLVARAFIGRGHEVLTTSRRGRNGSRTLDLDAGASTLDELDGFDAIVDCSDSARVAPCGLVRALAKRGVDTPIFEASADPHRLAELPATIDSLGDSAPPVIVGVGVYPGLSNLLAQRVVDDLAEVPQELDVLLSWSIWSAAGSGTCALMVDALSKPLRGWKDGRLLLCDPIEDVVRTPLFAGMPRWGLQVGFPEIEILQRSTNALTIRTIMSPRPGVPWAALSTTQWAARHGLLGTAVARAVLGASFRLLRRGLLRRRRTGARIAIRAASSDRIATCVADIDDAFAAAAHGTVGIVEEGVRAEPTCGLRSAEQVVSFDAVASRVREMGTRIEVGATDLTGGTSRVV